MSPHPNSMFAQRLWGVFWPDTRFENDAVFEDFPLIASFFYYSFTILLARLLLLSVRRLLPTSCQTLTGDFVIAFATCACSLENTMIRQAYGVGGYAAVMFITAMWFSLYVKSGFQNNPCSAVMSYMKSSISLPLLVCKVAAQLAGGLLSYRYARLFWFLELTTGHGYRYSTLHCSSDLSVSTTYGFGLEFSATLLDATLALITFTPFFVIELGTKISLSILMVLGGVHMTGMFMNPVNASNQNFGCHGTSTLDHILVYWVAPLLASVLAVKIYNNLTHATDILKGIKNNAPAQSKYNENTVNYVNGNMKYGYTDQRYVDNEKSPNNALKQENMENSVSEVTTRLRKNMASQH